MVVEFLMGNHNRRHHGKVKLVAGVRDIIGIYKAESAIKPADNAIIIQQHFLRNLLLTIVVMERKIIYIAIMIGDSRTVIVLTAASYILGADKANSHGILERRRHIGHRAWSVGLTSQGVNFGGGGLQTMR
jgi:hypothetical protein